MMPVLEISKRRSRFKQTPPGFPKHQGNDFNNNYSIQTNETSPINHAVHDANPVRMSSAYSNGNKDFIPVLQNLRSASGVSLSYPPARLPWLPSHMMPVIEVARKRAKDHMAPPGFKQLPVLDCNNNAKTHDKKGSKTNQPVTHTASRASEHHSSKLGFTLTSCIKAIKSEIFLTPEEIASLKPQCLRGQDSDDVDEKKVRRKEVKKDAGISGKEKLKRGLRSIKKYTKKFNVGQLQKTEEGIIYVEAVQRPDVVGGQEVVVNVLTFDPEEEADVQDIQIRDLTPDSFLETFEYYEMVTEIRKNMTRIAYTLGDMLVAGDLQGDKEEWTTFNEILLEEERAWKKKCREDEEFFKLRGRSMGETPPLKTRMREYARDKLTKAKSHLMDVCPCFF